MENSHDFAVLKFLPFGDRGEVVNVGIVVFRPNGVDVRLESGIRKMRNLVSHLDVGPIDDLVSRLSALLEAETSRTAQMRLLEKLKPFTVSKLGSFRAISHREYEFEVAQLVSMYIKPRCIGGSQDVRKTRASSRLKRLFQSQGILGSDASDIDKHRVVASFPLPSVVQLCADFAYRNGKFHVIQAIDLNVEISNANHKFRETCEKAIVLDQATYCFGQDVGRYVVFSRPRVEEPIFSNALDLLRRYSAKLIDIDDTEQMFEFSAVFGAHGLIAH